MSKKTKSTNLKEEVKPHRLKFVVWFNPYIQKHTIKCVRLKGGVE